MNILALPIDYRSPTTRDAPDPDKRVRPAFVVLVVLGVCLLATVVVPKYDDGHANGGAKLSAAKSDLASLCGAVNRFAADNGRLPTAAEGLNVLALPRSRTGPYLEEIRQDPWGHDYDYRPAPAAGVAFEVRSAGPDGRFGTADDIVWQ